MTEMTINWTPISISLFALIFSVLSFWWMNWRPGRLNVGNIRVFAAGFGTEESSESKNLVIVTLPLVFWNSGACPLLIDDLRMIGIEESTMPTLKYEAVDHPLTNSSLEREGKIQRDYFFLPLALKANEIAKANVVFYARTEKFKYEAIQYRLRLEAQISTISDWKKIKEITLDFSMLDNMGLYNLNEMYSVFPYHVNEDT